jgi:hypothetical protein
MDTLGLLPYLLEEFQDIDEDEFDGSFEEYLSLKGLSSKDIDLLLSHVDEEGNIIDVE